jgi:hypothetical protein
MKLFTKTAMGLLFLAPGMAGELSAQSTGTVTGSVITQPCANNGVIGATVTGMTPPLSYTYSNFSAGITVIHSNVSGNTDQMTNVPAVQFPYGGNAGNWFISATDGTNSAGAMVTVVPSFSFNAVDSAGFCPNPSTVQAFFSGGTSPFSVLWTNMTNSSTYNTNPAYVSNGQYSLQATDNSGCIVRSTSTGSGGVLFVYANSNIQLSFSGQAANCTNGTQTVTATGGTSPYSYQWSNNATSQSINGLTMGQYSVVVTDNIGCQQVGYTFVSQAVNINFNSTITQPTCLQTNGAVTTFVNGGTSPYTFLWSNGATTQNLSGVPAGFYQLKITDAAGCQGQGSAFLSASTPITVTYTANPSSCTSPTGSATLTPTGGATPYTVVWYTFPSNTAGVSISGKPPGNYSFKITDNNGCIRNGAATIPPTSVINANIVPGIVICPATTGSLAIGVVGTAPPFTYLWNNSATTSSITGVPLGAYSCTITDNGGCKVVKHDNLMQTSLVNANLNTNNVNCIFNTNGSIIANGTGGTPPYSYAWSNNQTGPANTGLGAGTYWVTVTDNNGCKKTRMATVGNNASTNVCYCTITGTVYRDLNSNCIQGSGETGIPNVQIHLSGFGYAYTNSNGVYSFQVPTGTYTITQTINQIYPLASCQSNNIVVSVTAGANCVTTVNFGNNVVPVSDLRIVTSNWNMAVPGNTYTQRVLVENDGTLTESTIKLGYRHDGQLTFGNSTPWVLTQQNTGVPTWYSITSGFPTLAPGSWSGTHVNYIVPTNIPVNTLVNTKDSIAKNAPIGTQWLTDDTPWNNVNNHNAWVVSSYDPNFKEVSPQGTGPNGDILAKDSILTYIVHFQNTGSYFAQNIVVIDSLDPNLQIKSMKPGFSDYRYEVTMTDNGVAKFKFPNINLKWKAQYGDVLSSGMFVYSVKLKRGLAAGTKIRNKAAIYFDYNEPIITNTTLNTLTEPTTGPVSVSTYELPDGEAMLFPNPTNASYTLLLYSEGADKGTLSIFDLSGREVSKKQIELSQGQNAITGDASSLEEGVYIMQLKAEGLLVNKKLSVRK